MRLWRYIVAALTACLCLTSLSAVASDLQTDVAEEAVHGEETADVDVAELVFGHIGDSYGWHLTTWKGEHITIPLPCIVHSSTGWHVFMSSRLEHGHVYEGLFISEDGKIMEIMPDGSIERPFDISITKNVASLMVSALLLILTVLFALMPCISLTVTAVRWLKVGIRKANHLIVHNVASAVERRKEKKWLQIAGKKD